MASLTPAPSVVDGELNVTKEDQEKINQFARLNARLEEVKDELATKSTEIQNYEDAISELEMKILEDEESGLHLQIGDILVKLAPEKTQSWLEDKMNKEKQLVEELNQKKETIVGEMTGLKADLYARFGNNIHLESS